MSGKALCHGCVDPDADEFLKADAETGFGTNNNERKGEKQTWADKEV